ncbi:hypothetical protein Goari_027523 [Gossypium aridum]|uniref:DUF4283 domain-containing protein n=1 Tax=Gossypium aridum TaxID=34290 RepID=A0A7J8YUH7_GOSAI|nr:hypothetical protein [Gossypium aridum]
MKNGPWNFNSHLLILDQLKMGDDPLTVQLHWVDFWLLIHDLYLGFMADIVAHQLGNFIGEFIEYDTTATQLGYKRIMKIRVREEKEDDCAEKWHIDVMIDEDLEGNTWRCMRFYEAPEETMREASWNLLRTLNDSYIFLGLL